MSEDEFWNLIEVSRDEAKRVGGMNVDAIEKAQDAAMERLLMALQPEDIIAFAEMFSRLSQRAYRWDLWAVAYWTGGGCSDDGFTDFRACLISKGRKVYEAALNDPDSIADLVDTLDMPYQAEGFQYLAAKAYEKKTGRKWYEVLAEREPTESVAPVKPIGERFDFDDEDEMAERFPRLIARMPEMGD